MSETNETNRPNEETNNDEGVNVKTVKEEFINDDTADQGETNFNSSNKNTVDEQPAEEDEAPAIADNEQEDAMNDDIDPSPVEVTQDSPQPENEEEGELWDLRMILSPTQLLQNPPIICSTATCSTAACCIWASNLAPDEPWYSCLDCQANDFGWPVKEEMPVKRLKGEHWKMMLERCTVDMETVTKPDIPIEESEEVQKDSSPSSEQEQEISSSAEGGEEWDCKIVLNVRELSQPKPRNCNTDSCDLAACCGWISNMDPNEIWFTCLDCQAKDYEGFPEVHELPLKYMTEEHRKLILEKCTNDPQNAVLPDLPTEPSLLVTTGEGKSSIAITPPPGANSAMAEGQSNVVVGAVKNGNKSKTSVTPVPCASKDKSANDKPKQPSKEALAIHRKWQLEADKLGGGKIEVSKPKAKKLIFDMMHDSFRPMNITEIYQVLLKAKVPSPVLKSSLDEMVDTFKGNPFDDGDSDEESDQPKKKKIKKSDESSDEFSGSLRLKEGRNANNNLFYVDYTKLHNNGNGLDPEKKNDLFADLEKAKCEEEALQKQLHETAAETARLLSEPLNDELATLLVEQEKEMDEINEKLEASRAFAGNEKHAREVKSRVSKMASVWRKRKRQCTEFLLFMEESTEGTITLKKCLKGDGQICIDSDENVVKQARAYAQTKKNAPVRKVGLKVRKSNGNGATAGLNPDPNFIGVTLDGKGNPQREYLNED